MCILQLFAGCHFALSVVTPCVLLFPEELPWRGHLWLNGEGTGHFCHFLLLLKQFSRKRRETAPGRLLKGIGKGTGNYGSDSLRVWGTQPGMGNVKHQKPLHHPQPEPLGLQKPQKPRGIMLLNSSSGRKWERWRERSESRAGWGVQLGSGMLHTHGKAALNHSGLLPSAIPPTFMQIAPS